MKIETIFYAEPAATPKPKNDSKSIVGESVTRTTKPVTTVKPVPSTPAHKASNLTTANTTKAGKGSNSSSPASSKADNSVLSAEEQGFEKVKIVSPTDGNQGPIVALALGLGITLMLLIFVGCRLRTVKRRIRKGRALHSNEADYLINGMYL